MMVLNGWGKFSTGTGVPAPELALYILLRRKNAMTYFHFFVKNRHIYCSRFPENFIAIS